MISECVTATIVVFRSLRGSGNSSKSSSCLCLFSRFSPVVDSVSDAEVSPSSKSSLTCESVDTCEIGLKKKVSEEQSAVQTSPSDSTHRCWLSARSPHSPAVSQCLWRHSRSPVWPLQSHLQNRPSYRLPVRRGSSACRLPAETTADPMMNSMPAEINKFLKREEFKDVGSDVCCDSRKHERRHGLLQKPESRLLQTKWRDSRSADFITLNMVDFRRQSFKTDCFIAVNIKTDQNSIREKFPKLGQMIQIHG